MKVRILGAHNTESRSTRLMTVLIDDVLALDAGALTSTLSFHAQLKVNSVLITHGHYDHLLDIPTFAMNLFLRERTFNLYALPAVRDALLTHFLNGEVYSRFLEKPLGNPVIHFHGVQPGEEFRPGGYQARAVALNHSIPAVGYQITSPEGRRLFYTGDTGAGLGECWRQVEPHLLVIEVTMSDRWAESAAETRHLAPALLHQELDSFHKIRGYLPRVVAVHMNADLETEIKTELARVATDLHAEITLAREGMVLEV